MISFSCSCGRLLSALDAEAGQSKTCPKCSQTNTVPYPSVLPSSPAPAPQTGRSESTAQAVNHIRRTSPPPTSGMALMSLITALFGFCVPGVGLFAIIFGIIGVMDVKRRHIQGKGLAVGGIVAGVIGLILVPLVMLVALGGLGAFGWWHVNDIITRIDAAKNMREISLAMQDYHAANEKFPQHAIYNEKGEPLLSWRVAVLPFLKHKELYEKFRLNESWDSEHNKGLLPKMPEIYLHPQEKGQSAKGLTYYQVFVGEPNEEPHPIFRRSKDLIMTIDKIMNADAGFNTIMIAEASKSVPWTKPADISYSSQRPLPRLGRGENRFVIVFADGLPRLFHHQLDEQLLRPAITMNDGKVVNLPKN